MLSSTMASLTMLAAPALAYSNLAVSSLSQLSITINSTTDSINHLEGCGYLNTTAAISSGATVTSGSACPSADTTITTSLNTINSGLQNVTASFKSSRNSSEANSSQVLAAFDDFADAYYALFNAMDLAECTYVLTTDSQSFTAQFGNGGLKDGFNDLAAELSTDLSLGVQIAGKDLKQQTHFGGTSFLATQVGGLQLTALAACKIITSIVESEGGGSS